MRSSFVLAAVLTAVAGNAHAGADDPKAKALYEEAKSDVTAGKWSEACPKLAESHKLSPKMNTVYRLAECYEHTGKRASAWKRYREAAIAATTAGETGKAKAALERAEKLEPGLPHLSIQSSPSSQSQGVEVRVDGSVVTQPSIPIDPGEHAVEVTAPGKKTYRSSVSIADDASTTTLAIPTLDNEVIPPAPIDKPIPADPPEPTPEKTSNTRVIGMVLAGTGVVALGVGGFLALRASSNYHDADSRCTPAGCDEAGAAASADARTLGNVATVVIGAGLAIGITGTVLWLTAPKAPDAARVGVTVLPTGLLLRGEF